MAEQTEMQGSLPINQIVQAYEMGHSALLLTGRSIHDFVVDEDRKLRPIIESLRRALRSRFGMLTITYCIAQGLDWDSVLLSEPDRQLVERALRAHQLLEIQPDQNELVRVIRGISSLCRTPTHGLKWSDGRDMRFAFLFMFGEHLTPGSLTNGTQTDNQIVATELSYLTAHSLALRSSGNLVIFQGRSGLMDDLVAGALHEIYLQQPDLPEKKGFLALASSLYEKASFDQGITPESVAYLTTNTPNRGLEALLRASHRTGNRISAKQLAEQKNRDVEEISEHTLTVLETQSVEKVHLGGRNVRIPLETLDRFGKALAEGSTFMPRSHFKTLYNGLNLR